MFVVETNKLLPKRSRTWSSLSSKKMLNSILPFKLWDWQLTLESVHSICFHSISRLLMVMKRDFGIWEGQKVDFDIEKVQTMKALYTKPRGWPFWVSYMTTQEKIN